MPLTDRAKKYRERTKITEEEYKRFPESIRYYIEEMDKDPVDFTKKILKATPRQKTAKDSTYLPVTTRYGEPALDKQGKPIMTGFDTKEDARKIEAYKIKELQKEPKALVKPTEAEIKRQIEAKRTPEEAYQDKVGEEIKKLGSLKTIRGQYENDDYNVTYPEQLEMIDAQILGITQNIYDATERMKKYKFLSTKQAKDVETLFNAIDEQLRSGMPPAFVESFLKTEYGITIEDLSITYKKSQKSQ